ncbi:MAG TPA: hypothetical protein VJ488_05430, partial [Dehalococcoidia bacterium]|nr:hypothetical protein [Dehalococcoidia bacterium]
MLTVKGKNPVECPVCGISGTLKVEGDKITVEFSKEERARSRLTLAGKLEHQLEIATIMKELAPRVPEVEARLAKYRSYLTPLTPPQKAK